VVQYYTTATKFRNKLHAPITTRIKFLDNFIGHNLKGEVYDPRPQARRFNCLFLKQSLFQVTADYSSLKASHSHQTISARSNCNYQPSITFPFACFVWLF